MKKMIVMMAVIAMSCGLAQAGQIMVQVAGPAKKYSQVKLENNTNVENFQCRIVTLKKEKGEYVQKDVYNVYDIDRKGDIDTNTSPVKRGVMLGLELPKDFPNDVKASVEYRSYPGNEVIQIHLYNTQTQELDRF